MYKMSQQLVTKILAINFGFVSDWLSELVTALFTDIYRKISNISCTKSQNLNDSRLVLHLSLPNLLKPGVK